VLHFGTHGSLEFMPGKQVRLLLFSAPFAATLPLQVLLTRCRSNTLIDSPCKACIPLHSSSREKFCLPS